MKGTVFFQHVANSRMKQQNKKLRELNAEQRLTSRKHPGDPTNKLEHGDRSLILTDNPVHYLPGSLFSLGLTDRSHFVHLVVETVKNRLIQFETIQSTVGIDIVRSMKQTSELNRR